MCLLSRLFLLSGVLFGDPRQGVVLFLLVDQLAIVMGNRLPSICLYLIGFPIIASIACAVPSEVVCIRPIAAPMFQLRFEERQSGFRQQATHFQTQSRLFESLVFFCVWLDIQTDQ